MMARAIVAKVNVEVVLGKLILGSSPGAICKIACVEHPKYIIAQKDVSVNIGTSGEITLNKRKKQSFIVKLCFEY
jgi:uncharacterized protein (UPF0254 family)